MIRPEGPPWHAPATLASIDAGEPRVHAGTLRSLRCVAGPSAVGEYLATLEALHGAEFARLAHEASVS